MTQDTNTASATLDKPVSKNRHRAGLALTSLIGLFLAFDAVTKIVHVVPVMEACQRAGIAAELVTGIGLLLLACTVVYAIPQTAVLGAILLTGYLGGAITIHVIARAEFFPVVFAATVGVLVWVSLTLREPRLIRLMLLRVAYTGTR